MKITTLIVVILMVLGLVYLINRRLRKTHTAFNALDEAAPWLKSQGVDVNSLKFNIYNDPAIIKHFGAVALVGTGKNVKGEDIGVMLEVIKGHGVIEHEFIVPEGIASWDKNAARIAKLNGLKLLNILSDMAYDHREKHNIEHPEIHL